MVIDNAVSSESEAIRRIYDAVSYPQGWEPALDALVEVSGCVSAFIAVSDLVPNGAQGPPYELSALSRLIRDNHTLFEEYFSRFAHHEVEGLAVLREAQRQQIIVDEEVWPENIAALKDREDFRFVREHFGIYRRLVIRLDDNRRWTDLAYFQLGAEHEQIPPSIVRKVSSFVPHIAKAVELGRTFVELRRRFDAVLGVLDRVRIGLCIVRHDGSVVIANEEARRVLEQTREIGLSRAGRLEFVDDDVAASVRQAIERVTRTAAGENDIVEFRASVGKYPQGDPGGASVLVEVAPTRDTLAELGRPGEYALLTLIDTRETTHVSTERLALAYGLSAAESAVCQLLVEGQTQPEIAEIRRVGVETVKSQSRSILRKTDTRSRVELVALALRTSPPIYL